MKYLILLCTVLTGCGGGLSLYQFDDSGQFACDMDPYRQQCANNTVIDNHIRATR